MDKSIDILNELQANGKLRRLVRDGIISTKIPTHMEIFYEYDKQKRVLKRESADIITELSDNFRINERNIYRIIKRFA